MKRVTEYRANKVLFNFLKSNHICGKVLLPINICSSVVDTLQAANMELLFADIAADTLCLETSIILERAKGINVLLYVHTYGVETDVVKLFNEVRNINPNIIIVDDKCLCLPEWNIGESAADLILYSTGAKKQVSLGEGGIGFIADKWDYYNVFNELFEEREYTIDSIMLFKAEDKSIEHKEKLNAIYRANLPKSIQFPEQFQHWRFNIWVENKEQILKVLFNNGLFASNHYKPIQSPVGPLPITGETGEGAMVAPNGETNGRGLAEKLYDHVINLFNDQYYTEQQALKTCEIINRIIK